MPNTSSSPLFTIVTVTRNAAATFPATLDSVAAQTFRGIEHLIVDGASTDDTVALAQRYATANPDLSVAITSEADHGLYHAMNKGLKRARGLYVIFLNAGDRLHSPSTLERVADQMADTVHRAAAVFYGETDLVDAQGRFLRHRRLSAPVRLTWKSFRSGMLVCHQSFYVRTDMAQSLLYNPRYRYSADFDWCVRVLQLADQKGEHIVNTGLVLTDYLAEGLTTAHHRDSLRERLRIMASHYGWPVALAMHAWFVVRALFKR